MYLELRSKTLDDGRVVPRGLCLIVDDKEESLLLDEFFGSKVGNDGLISVRKCECRLSDGCGEHYLYVDAEQEAESAELQSLREEAAWVRRKLKLPEGCSFASGPSPTLAGQMHVTCAHADGYTKYIESHKCEDKQGEIARQAVEINKLRRILAHVPGGVAIQAKEAAGFPDYVYTA